jgi:PAS domain S-box-containing protein
MISNGKSKTNFKGIERLLLENISDIVAIVDQKGTFEYINEDVHKSLMGYSREDTIGNSMVDIIYPDDLNKFIEALKNTFENGESVLEIRIKHKQDHYEWLEFRTKLILDADNNKKVLIIGRKITERKKMEQKLRESEEKFRTITTYAKDAILYINESGIITNWNKAAEEMFGYTSGDVIGKQMYHIILPKKTHQFFNKGFKLSRKTHTSPLNGKTFELTGRKCDGNEFPMEISLSIIKVKDNLNSIIIIRNISERLKIEKKLRESKEKYRLLFESTPFGVSLLDSTGIIIDSNIAHINSGYNREDLVGKHFKDLNIIPTKYLPEISAQFRSLVKKGYSEPKEIQIYRKDGELEWVYLQASVVKKGNETLFQIMTQNISAIKEAEQKLKESELHYRTIINSINDPIHVMDRDFKIITVNPAFEQYVESLNLEGEITGKKLYEAFPFLPNQIKEEYNKVFNDGMTLQTSEKNTFNNRELFTEVIKIPIVEKGEVNQIITILHNVTERHNAELKIIESEKKYRNLFNSAPFSIILFNIEGKMLDCNDITLNITGYSKEDLIGKNFKELDIFSETDSSEIEKRGDMVKQGEVPKPREIEIKKKDGTSIWIASELSFMKLGDNMYIQALIQDVTERKESEQKLKESEEKYRTLFESSPFGISLLDSNGIVVESNSATELIGYDIKDMVGKHFKDLMFVPEEFIPEMTNHFQNLVKTGSSEPSEILLIDKDDNKVWVYVQSSKLKLDDQTYFLIMSEDITSLKETEQKLKDSEEKYRNFVQNFQGIAFQGYTDFSIGFFHGAAEEITDYLIEDFLSQRIKWDQIIHPDDIERINENVKEYHSSNKETDSREYRIVRKDGKIRWVLEKNQKIYDYIKEKEGVRGIIVDITERKETERKLEDSEKKYRDLLETSAIGVLEIDLVENRIIFVNSKLTDIIGYTIEELQLTKEIHKFVHPEDLKNLFSTNEERDLEFRIISKEGKIKWLSGQRINNYDDIGELISFRLWLQDITEKKMYESLIYELNINFLKFTTDIKENMTLLLTSCRKMLNCELVLYVFKNVEDGTENYNIIASDKETYSFDSKYFHENLFISELFNQIHDIPQEINFIEKTKYNEKDDFIKRYKSKGVNLNTAYGRLIKSGDLMNSAICGFFKEETVISQKEQLVLFLISDAMVIEQGRWEALHQLKEQNKRLSEINRLKSELLTRTSHELKTPLVSIKGFTEILLNLEDLKFDYYSLNLLKEIQKGSKRLEKIINSLLDTSRLEQGKIQLEMKENDLVSLIKECVNELKTLSELRKQTISLELHKELITIFDEERIYEVISNIIINAIKYTPPEGKISIRTQIKEDLHLIIIQDNGIGFIKEEKDRVFTKFGKIERYGQGLDVDIEGSGLGLYIAKRIVELHEGEIWIESEGRNKGSTFYISLPIKSE